MGKLHGFPQKQGGGLGKTARFPSKARKGDWGKTAQLVSLKSKEGGLGKTARFPPKSIICH